MAYTTIDDPSAHFQTKIYSGDGNDDRNITFDGNSDLAADWLWFKRRNQDVNHIIFDSTAGVNKRFHSNNANVEANEANFLQAFQSDGFQVGTDADINASGGTYVAWGWKANGGSRTTFTESGTNPGGGRQVNTTAGFSLIDYTGTVASGASGSGTIAHGLGAVPQVMIVKGRSVGGNWNVYHHKIASDAETDRLKLNENNAANDFDGYWNDTAPTSSVFTLGKDDNVNLNDGTYVAYLFTPIQGYSKFGSYTGTGTTNGAFVHTGFKPAWIMVKKTNEAEAWFIADSKRTPINPNDDILEANDSAAEGASTTLDLLSNGFKFRHENGNTTGDSYIYLAFAEHPFVSSKGVPTTAR